MRHGAGLWRGWLIAALALIGVHTTLPIESLTSSIFFDVFALLCVTMLLVGVRRNRPPRAAVWYLIGAGQLAWALGDTLFSWYQATGLDPFPSPADLLYLPGYPLLGAGIVLLVRTRARGADRGGLIDAGIVATGVSLPAWVYLIQPLAADNAVSVAERVIATAYPVGDLLLLVLVIRLFTTSGIRTPGFWMLSAGVAGVLAADSIFTLLVVDEATFFNLGADLLWMSSYLLFSLAAMHPSTAALTQAADPGPARLGRGRLVVLGAASLPAPAVLLHQGLTRPDDISWAPIVLGAVILFVLVVLRMGILVTQVQEQAGLLAALSNVDGLTGVANRRAWDAALATALADAARTGRPLVIALLDLDRFKDFYDRFGHLAGDQLLTAAAQRWARLVRPGDLLARYGGEEFGVLLPGAGLPEAEVVLERLRAHTPDGQSISAGIARWDGTEDADALFGRADAALYRAKRTGRNRVLVADAGNLEE